MRLGWTVGAATVAAAMIGTGSVTQAAQPEQMPPVFAQTAVGKGLQTGATVSVPCPAGSVILSGGWQDAETDAYGVTASMPSGNGWQIRVADTDNFIQPWDSITVWATCGSSQYFTAGVNIVQANAHVYGILDGVTTASPTAVCPRGEVPVGGGFDRKSLGVALVATAPSITPNDGWGWYMTGRDSELSDDFFITAYAVCAPVAGSPPIHPSDTANCFNNVAVAGGAILDGWGDLSTYIPANGVNPSLWYVIESGGTLQATSGICVTVPSPSTAAQR